MINRAILFFSYADPRYPEISRGAFDIKPSRGDLDAYVSHVSQNKVLVKVTFIARYSVVETIFKK